MQTEIRGTEELQRNAAEFAAKLVPYAGAATVIALSGELGAGKTTFTQGVARAFGVEEAVTSPTFVIEKVYELAGNTSTGGFSRLIHIDAYRLKGAHELEVLGWHELVAEPGNLILLEWPERVAELVPSDAIRITLQGSGDSRIISYDLPQKQ